MITDFLHYRVILWLLGILLHRYCTASGEIVLHTTHASTVLCSVRIVKVLPASLNARMAVIATQLGTFELGPVACHITSPLSRLK